jgi:tetratricopeptide (TPR) repeat protein
VEDLTPIALVGAGGIGKTSIALIVLHHNRIKQRFGGNRRFIRCDQFPVTLTHFLSRLSKVIGAGVENPEDLASLLPFLSSKTILVVLDNAESILDPQGANSQEIYAAVEELCRLETICICITSRISAVPPDCETFEIPVLSMESARDTFYRSYKTRERPDSIDDVLKQLDFHPLSINLLATVAQQNKWRVERLVEEWERRRTGVLQTEHKTSLAAAIEVSLASPMFGELGPDARGLLEVVAFFPQGVDEANLKWLFPTVSNPSTIFDKFCVLSLTYQSDGFITMLAPLRDYLRPNNPKSSPLLCRTKDCYFTRMSIVLLPNKPGFRDAEWIMSEDVNVEHLLDVFTSVDANSGDVWDACTNFMAHLYWHKKRQTVLRPKLEDLPDGHRSKPQCLFELSRLLYLVGNHAERKRLLTHALKLERERENNRGVALMLLNLSDANRLLHIHEEGAQQAKEALEVYERLGDAEGQAGCLETLAYFLCSDNQLDAAEEMASRAIKLLPEKGQEFRVCQAHRVLGDIYHSKGEREKAIHHLEVALGIASTFNWYPQLSRIHRSLASLFYKEGEFSDALAHTEQAQSHTANDTYSLGRTVLLQARVCYRQHRLEDAKSEALRALEIFEKLGATGDLGRCRTLLQNIEEATESEATENWSTSCESDSGGEFPVSILSPSPVNSPFFARGTPPRINGHSLS